MDVGEAKTRAPVQPHPGLEAMYREHQPFVWRSTRRLGLPQAAVDDAVQDVFLVVNRRLAEWTPRGSIRSWLFAITLHVVQAHRRTEKRHRRRVDAYGADGPVPSLAAHPGDTILLQQLLDQLDDGRRAVFILAELERMSAPEIAETLGINPNTVYSRLRSARIKLQEAVRRLETEEARR